MTTMHEQLAVRGHERKGTPMTPARTALVEPGLHKTIPSYEPPDLSRLQLVRVGDLNIDPSYQRHFSAKRNEERARDFRPDQIGFIEASQREDGTLWCVDGQHRARLLLMLFGEDTKVPALIHHGMSVEEEANRFIYVNSHRAAVAPVDIYRARRARGDATVAAIDKVLAQHGFIVAGHYREGVISAAAALLTIHERYGIGILEATIITLERAWGHNRDAFRADTMIAMAWTLSTYFGALDIDALVQRLRDRVTAKQVIVQARARRVEHGGDLGTSIANVLVDTYNAPLPRQKRLPTPADVRPNATKRVNDQKRLEALQREARDAMRAAQREAEGDY